MCRSIITLFLLTAACVAHGQTSSYYFDIQRPDCCRISSSDWQQIAVRLRGAGIPTFFGLSDVLNYREPWHPVKLRRTSVAQGWLMLGPFDSESTAIAVLYRLPKLLPNHMVGEDERSKGVEPDPFGYQQNWRIGMYQITGCKTQTRLTSISQDWDAFWSRFSAAVRNKNRMAIKSMASSRFDWQAIDNSIGAWIRNLDRNNLWYLVQNSVNKGTMSCDPIDGRPCRRTRDSHLYFVFEHSRWHFSGIGGV